MSTDKPRTAVSLPAGPDVVARLDFHFGFRGELEDAVYAPATLAARLPAYGASAHALRAGGVGAAVTDVFSGEQHAPCALESAALGPHAASASHDAPRAMTAVAVDEVRTFFGRSTHAGRPLTGFDSEVLARAGTSTHS